MELNVDNSVQISFLGDPSERVGAVDRGPAADFDPDCRELLECPRQGLAGVAPGTATVGAERKQDREHASKPIRKSCYSRFTPGAMDAPAPPWQLCKKNRIYLGIPFATLYIAAPPDRLRAPPIPEKRGHLSGVLFLVEG